MNPDGNPCYHRKDKRARLALLAAAFLLFAHPCAAGERAQARAASPGNLVRSVEACLDNMREVDRDAARFVAALLDGRVRVEKDRGREAFEAFTGRRNGYCPDTRDTYELEMILLVGKAPDWTIACPAHGKLSGHAPNGGTAEAALAAGKSGGTLSLAKFARIVRDLLFGR